MAKRESRKPAGDFQPTPDWRIVVLNGVEEMLKRKHLETLRQVMETAHGPFETFLFPGATAPLADVLDELRTYSLMQSFKIVIVDEADEFLKRYRDAMNRYAESPAEQALLILRCGTWHKGNFDKAVAKVGAVVSCDPLPTAQLPGWVAQQSLDVHDRKISPAAAKALSQRMGSDLMLLDSELGKLALMVEPGQMIDVAQVEQMVGRSSDEKAWAFKNAVIEALATPGGGSAAAMVSKLHELVDLAGESDVPIQFALTDLMRQLYYAAALRQRGADPYAIPKQLGMWGPTGPFVNLLKRVSPAKAQRWLDRLMHLQWRQRNSLGDGLRNLECFCVVLADEV